jgi:hypothetical protein
MESYAIQQLSVFVEDRTGELAELTSVLYQGNVTIKALLLLTSTDFGVLRLLVDDPDKGKEILTTAGYTVTQNRVFAVKVDNRIGTFHVVANVLSEQKINITYTYAFRSERDGMFVCKVDPADFEKAIGVLQAAGMEIVEASQFY